MRTRCKPRLGSTVRQHYYLDCEHCGPVCVYCGHRPKRSLEGIASGTCPACLHELARVNGRPIPGLHARLLPGLRAILERNGKGNNEGEPLGKLQKALKLNNVEWAQVLGITRRQLIRYKKGQPLRPSTIERIIGSLERRVTPPATSHRGDVSLPVRELF